MTRHGDIMTAIKNSNGEVSMTMKTTKTPKSSGWLAKVSRVLIFTMLFSIAMPHGWYQPNKAQAAVSSLKGVFAKRTSAGTQAITGVGFTPKAVIFFWTKNTAFGTSAANGVMGYGFAGGSPIVNGSVVTSAQDNVISSNDGWIESATYAIQTLNPATPASVARASVASFDADGFTLNWNTADAVADQIHFIALAGTDITNVKVGQFNGPALATNPFAVTGVGFTPDIVLFASPDRTATVLDTITASGALNLGFMAGGATPSQGSLGFAIRDAQAAASHGSTLHDAQAITGLRRNAIDQQASYVSMDADGFSLNFTPGGAAPYVYLAIKGGQHKIGSFTKPTAAGSQPVTGVGFQPNTLMLFSHNDTGANGTAVTADPAASMSIGGATSSTARGAVWMHDKTLATTDVNMISHNTLAMRMGLSNNGITDYGQADFTSFGADGFTLNWTTSDATARRVLYWALGNSIPACAAVTPTGLAAGAMTPTSVPLTWTPNANNNYYRVYRGGVQINVDGATTTGSYTDNTASVDGAYSYTVSGYNTAGTCESTQSTAVPVNTPAVTPVAPTVANPQLTTLDVTINTETPANPTSVTYAIRINGGAYTNQYVQAGGTVGASAVWQTKATWATKTVTGLANGTAYTFDVQARNTPGTTTAFGTSAGGSTASPCIAGPPTALAAGTATTTTVPLTWTGGVSTNYFNVYRNGVKISTDGAVTTGSFTDSGPLTPSTTYAYYVRGYNTANACESTASTAVNKSTLAVTPAAPVATNTGTGNSANVTIGSDANSTEATYAIRINGGAFTNQFVQANGSVGASAVWQTKAVWATKTVTGLTAATNYTFDVEARNGNSELVVSSPAFGPTAAVTPNITLPSSISSCSGCHDYPPSDGTRSGTTGSVAGSHQPHEKPGYVCSVCHVAPATETSTDFSHRDGNITMQSPLQGGAYTGGTHAQTNTPSLTSCSIIACHGGSAAGANNPTPIWGSVTKPACTTCHSGIVSALTASLVSGGTITQRRAMVAEFGMTYNHGAANANACGVCHMEGATSGSQTTGAYDPAYHANGTIELRDANTGTTMLGVTFGGANAGLYSSTGSPAPFNRFSRNLGVKLESDTAFGTVAAIQMNHCLKCHDANGSVVFAAGGSTTNPFATGVAPANADAHFNIANASYHPVKGRQNNSYSDLDTMVAPYNQASRTPGSITLWGDLMSCFDCHAASGASGTQTSTVVAHGGATTLRAVYNATAGSPTTLCVVCHKQAVYWGSGTTAYTHVPGLGVSALATVASGWTSGGRHDADGQGFAGCTVCHGTTESSNMGAGLPTQALRAINSHGFDTVSGVNTTWTSGARAWAFLRYGMGNATENMPNWDNSPATCYGAAQMCGDSIDQTYTPGGTY